jgi:multidrug efflux pump subunit AcrA (membrane-fusion protein)
MFSSFKIWQVAVLVGIVAVVGAGTFGLIAFMSDSGDVSLGEDEQLIPVRLGNLVNEVSVNGSVLFPNRESLVFGSPGTVSDILVETGQRVSQGEPLASFDPETIANLDKAVASARVGLRDSQESLEDFQTVSEFEIAESKSKVSAAKMNLAKATDALDLIQNIPDVQMFQSQSKVSGVIVSLQNADDSLTDILAGPTAQALASAGAKASSAQLSLQIAEDALAGLQNSPTDQELAQSEARVTDAQIAERAAQEAFDEFKAGPSEDDISDARNAVSSSVAQATNAKADLNVTKTDWGNRLETAELDFQAKTDDYIDQFKTWLGIDLDSSQLNPDAGAALVELGIDLDQLFPQESRFNDLIEAGIFSVGFPEDDPATVWNETTIFTWQNFSPAAIVATCDAFNVPPASLGFCVSHEFDMSASAYKASMDSNDALKAQSAKAITSAESSVGKALDALTSSQETLADTLGPIDALALDDKQHDLDVASASLLKALDDLVEVKSGAGLVEIGNQLAQVALAKSHLDQAIEDIAELKSATDPTIIANQRNQVSLAQANLSDAEDELALLRNGDPIELETKLIDVEVARLTLENREQDLADLLQGPDLLDMAVMRANMISAQASLADAEEKLANSVITAPWDGVITFINAETGQTINPNTPIVEIVDTSVVEIDGVVDEIDVLFVQVGSSAAVTMDALPGQLLAGEVSFIATEPETQQGVVSFPIRILISLPPGLEVPAGLSAVANVVIREDTGVLMVPINSLYGSFDQPTLKVMNGGQLIDRPVTLGNSDDFWIIVSDGISEGDMVVMESEGSGSDQFNFGGNFRRFGGNVSVIQGAQGFGGGGGGGRGGPRGGR